jgi:hypothetical protein
MSYAQNALYARADFKALHMHKTANGFQASYKSPYSDKQAAWMIAHGATPGEACAGLLEQLAIADRPRVESTAPDSAALDDFI